MRITRLIVALIAAMMIVVLVAGCSTAPKVDDPDRAIKEARALVAKAAKEKDSDKQKEDYSGGPKDKLGGAIGRYNAVVNQFKDSPRGAQALFELGVLYETAQGKTKNLKQAYTEFSTLLNRFDRKRAELTQRGYLANEIEQVQSLASQARVKKKNVAVELDVQNSKYKLFGVLNLYKVMDFLVNITGKRPAFSYWFAIILVTFMVKILITPLTKAQFKAMKEMQKISPLVKEIQEKYKGDQQAIGAKTMDLYKEHHINPFASCLPMLVQMPILMLLYYMIRTYEYQFAKGTFLWIGSSLKHMYDFNVPMGAGGTVWVTAGNLSEPDLILVVLYVISMYISTKLSNVDPTQAEQQKMMAVVMPVMFAFIFAGFPSAFLLYWLVFNILQTVQQYMILHKHGEPVPAVGPALPETPSDDTPRPRRRRRR
jgi:YidC/Oxa1 family membrane protein insertase